MFESVAKTYFVVSVFVIDTVLNLHDFSSTTRPKKNIQAEPSSIFKAVSPPGFAAFNNSMLAFISPY